MLPYSGKKPLAFPLHPGLDNLTSTFTPPTNSGFSSSWGDRALRLTRLLFLPCDPPAQPVSLTWELTSMTWSYWSKFFPSPHAHPHPHHSLPKCQGLSAPKLWVTPGATHTLVLLRGWGCSHDLSAGQALIPWDNELISRGSELRAGWLFQPSRINLPPPLPSPGRPITALDQACTSQAPPSTLSSPRLPHLHL